MDRGKAAKSALWSLVENGGLAFTSFAALILYSRYLSPSDFGVFSIVLAYVELVGVVISMLFHDALVQREDATDLHFDTAFTFTLLMSLVFLAASLLLAPWFGRLVEVPQAAPVLAWTALCFPSQALSATLVARQRRELSFRALAIRSMSGRLAGAALGIGLVLSGAGIWGLVTQQVAISLCGSLVLWIMASKRPRLRLSRHALSELLKFGVYAVSSVFLMFAVKRLFTIAAGIAVGAELAGYLNLSFRAVDAFWAIAATAVGQVALPVLSRLQDSHQRLRRAYTSALELTCLALYPCFVGIAVTAAPLVDVLFGSQWRAAVPFVITLALLTLVQAPRLLNTPALTAMGRPHAALIGLVLELAAMGGAFLILKPSSLAAVVAIWVGRELLVTPLMAWVVQRVTGVGWREQFGGALVPLAASAGMAGAVVAFRQILPNEWSSIATLATLVPVGAAAFALCAWAVGRSSVARGVEFARVALQRRQAEAAG